MTTEACCEDWKIGVKKINGALSWFLFHAGFPQYDGPFFRFCPWCGKPVQQPSEVPVYYRHKMHSDIHVIAMKYKGDST